tara:strand:- start:349 stop:753 length:405 start_codon:yes stop_codon:yes gene_type:complete
MKDIFQSVIDDIHDKLDDKVGLDAYGRDLHHELCNMDYFIIGTYRAKQFLGDDAFEAIEMVKDYEQSNFGEVSTDLSEPERVVNMLAYIIGEHVLAESDHLQDKWDVCLTGDDLTKIAEEIACINSTKLYREAA